MKLHQIAHARSGDKGDTAQISIIAFRPEDYALLERHVTAERIANHFSAMVTGAVSRYELPRLGALLFIMEGALGGGVTRTLALDAHGKCLASTVLAMALPSGPERSD